MVSVQAKSTSLKSLFTRELIAILIVSGAATSAQALLTPVLPLYMRDVGLSDQNIGLAFSVMMVGIAISEVFWGWAVDRVNLKIVLFIGAVAYGIMILVLLTPTTLIPFLIVMVIYGVSRSPLFIVGRWYMGVNAPEDIKAQAFGIMNLTWSVPNIVAGFVSGFIAEAWGFRNAIRFSAAVPLLVGIVLLFVSRWLHFKRPDPVQATTEDGESKPASVDGNARLVTFYLGAFGVIMFIALGISMTYLPLFASDIVHLAPSQIGILFGFQGIIQTLLILPLGRLADKVGKRVFIPVGMVVVTLAMFAVVISRNFTMMLVSVFIFAMGQGMYFPSVSAILSERVPATWIGTAMGIYGLLEDVGWMIGPAVGGWLLNYWDLQAPFIFGGVAALLGIPLYFVGRRLIPAMQRERFREVRGQTA
jgi:DHA1 family quinolone resistance protein-like MFS transporter